MDRRQMLRRAGIVSGGIGAFATGYLSRMYTETSQRPSDDPTATVNEETAYFVSPDGQQSNPGTRDQPFETVEAALERVEPGETVYLRGGVYRMDETVELRNLSGTADDRITVAGYPTERPVLQFQGPEAQTEDPGPGVMLTDVSYLLLENMVVRNSPRRGIHATHSTDNIFQNLTVMNNNHAGIGLHKQSSDNLIRNVVASNNYDRETNGTNADGIQCSYSTNNRIVDSDLFYNADDGLDLWASTSCEVERCKSWNNGRDEGNGNGFKLGGSPGEPAEDDSGGHRVSRNVAFQNENIGFSYNLATVPIRMVNNTAWDNSINYWFQTVDHRLVNNISANGDESLDGNVETTTNSWDLGITNPAFLSHRVDSDRFLRLSERSPCIDAGSDVGLEYRGTAPDLGAYEYQPSDATPVQQRS